MDEAIIFLETLFGDSIMINLIRNQIISIKILTFFIFPFFNIVLEIEYLYIIMYQCLYINTYTLSLYFVIYFIYISFFIYIVLYFIYIFIYYIYIFYIVIFFIFFFFLPKNSFFFFFLLSLIFL